MLMLDSKLSVNFSNFLASCSAAKLDIPFHVSYLDDEGEEEGDLLEVLRLEDRLVEEEDSCCSYCEEGGEAEGIG